MAAREKAAPAARATASVMQHAMDAGDIALAPELRTEYRRPVPMPNMHGEQEKNWSASVTEATPSRQLADQKMSTFSGRRPALAGRWARRSSEGGIRDRRRDRRMGAIIRQYPRVALRGAFVNSCGSKIASPRQCD
jgi:hypothetical protein